jgi:hypothetical protein
MTDAPDRPAQRPPRPDRDWDGYMALIATFTALLALVVAAYTANLQRKQVRAQVWPRLEITRRNNRAIAVTNSGVGPARIKGVKVEVDGRPVKTWDDVLRGLGLQPTAGGSTINRRVIPPGEVVEAYAVMDDDAGRAVFSKVFRENEKRVGMLVCYCSVLDQCWLFGAGGRFENVDPDEEVDECPIASGDQFAR